MDDPQAVSRIKQGDLAGLEYLVKRYQAQAVQTAYLITGDPAAAEDIAQNAFIRAAQRIDQFDDRREFRPWFLKIVVNDAVKAARRQNRFISLEAPPPEIADWIQGNKPEPEKIIEERELRQSVWSAIQRLPPEQRAVIIQRHFLEMSEAEMAEELHRPGTTIKWWLYTARKTLKSLLGEVKQEAEGESDER